LAKTEPDLLTGSAKLWKLLVKAVSNNTLKKVLFLFAMFILAFAAIIWLLVYFQSAGSNWLPTTPHRRG